MSTTASSTAARPAGQSLDAVLSAVKTSHQLFGCRTCGLMATFKSVEPTRRTA